MSWKQVVVALECRAAKDLKGSCRCDTKDKTFLWNGVFLERKTLNTFMKKIASKPYSYFLPNQVVL